MSDYPRGSRTTEATGKRWQAKALTWFEFQWLEGYGSACWHYATSNEAGEYQGKPVRCVPAYGTKEETEFLGTITDLPDPENRGFNKPENNHKYYKPTIKRGN